MRILWAGDLVGASGFGRIGNEVSKRLLMRGHQLVGGSINYSGWPQTDVPFHVYPLAGRDIWAELTNIIAQHQPEMVVMCQDFPYSQTLYRACRVDWSKVALLTITPIDGTPIRSEWLDLVDDTDGTMVISKFGVEAMRKAGKRVGLCHPGVDTGHFKPATPDEKKALREQAGIPTDAFVLGMFAMNQGRKNIPATLKAFFEFALDKPDARLLLDMDKLSPAGFDIPDVCKQCGWDVGKLIFREGLLAKGLLSLRDRFCLLDAHSVISFREGFGLPLLESQACRIPAIALDWCSGTEICGDGKGVLIPTCGPGRIGTWGGAQDYDPDLPAFVAALNKLYYEPGYRAAVAEAGMQWAVQQTWDNAASAVDVALTEAMARHIGTWADTHSEVVSAISQHHYSSVQPVHPPNQVSAITDSNHTTGPGGDYPGGRLQHGVQPNGTVRTAVSGGQVGNEPGVCCDVQPGREYGDSPATVLLEQRHGRATELVRANGGGGGG